MGVAENFHRFCSNLIVSNQSDISRRYRAITRRLNAEYWGTTSESSHSLYIGSYGRNTAIDGLSDLDMLFRLPYNVYARVNGYSSNGQSALLQEVRQSIKKTYSQTDVGGDGQVVVVPFSDGITFEVLPVFLNRDDESYTYPDANNGGSWRVTNPSPELAAMAKRDSEVGGNLRRLCRMMRAWRRKWSVPIKGLLLDTLAYRFIEAWPHKNKSYVYYDWMVRDFFNTLASQEPNKDYWAAPGSRSRVYRIGQFESKARKCQELSVTAIGHDSAGRVYSAGKTWREIFGSYYAA